MEAGIFLVSFAFDSLFFFEASFELPLGSFLGLGSAGGFGGGLTDWNRCSKYSLNFDDISSRSANTNELKGLCIHIAKILITCNGL